MNRAFVRLRIHNDHPVLQPGELLECEYSIVAEDEPIQSVETSVIWYTEGKGDEDLGVHFFDRRRRNQSRDGDLQALYRFKTIMPYSPMSYTGELIVIRWCIRVRVFWNRGREMNFDYPIQLGNARIVEPVDDVAPNASSGLAS